MAVKPLIEPETTFLDPEYTDDLITIDRDVEAGILEEKLEQFVRRSGLGNTVSLQTLRGTL